MMIKISKNEWETLSAYLDGELVSKEQSRLEKQLETRADLRAALEELGWTRAILRSQPPIRAPRNFTLKPEMVGLRAAWSSTRRIAPRLYPVFQLTSALASVLFVVVLLGDFLVGSSREISRSMAVESTPMEVVMEVPAGPELEIEAEVTAEKVSERSIPIVEVEKALDMASATDEALLAMTEPVAEGAAYPAPVESSANAAVQGEEVTVPTPTLMPTSLPTLPPEEEPPGAEYQSPIQIEERSGDLTRPVLRLAEIALAILAIATGVVAFYLRRIVRV